MIYMKKYFFLLSILIILATLLISWVYFYSSEIYVIESPSSNIYIKKIDVSLGREYYVSISQSKWGKYNLKKDYLFTHYDPKIFFRLSNDSLYVYSTVLASNVPRDFNSSVVVVQKKLSESGLDSINRIPHFLRANLIEFP